MNASISIDLPRFYSQINNLRQSQGLGQIEPETIAVQTNLRFAVVQRRNLNLKNNSIELTQNEAEVLCEVIEDLFKVRPSFKSISRSIDNDSPVASYELIINKLYDAINEQRTIEKRIPVETAVIAVRLGVKFLIMRRRVLDFKGNILLLNDDDINALEHILAEQFAVKLPNGLINLCSQLQPAPTAEQNVLSLKNAEPKPTSWMSSILRRLASYGGVRQRLYQIDVSALFLYVIQQRSEKSLKSLSPSEVQRRYSEHLMLELHLKKDQDPLNIALTEVQIGTVAHIIYREFNVIIPNINNFTSRA